MDTMRYLFVFALVFLLYSCDSDKRSVFNFADSDNKSFTSDTSSFESVERINIVFNKFKQALVLDDFDSSFNGFRMRVWFYKPFVRTANIFEFKEDLSLRKAKYMTFEYTDTSVVKNAENIVTPKDGWSNFYKLITHYQLLEVAKIDEVWDKKRYDVTDTPWVLIELSNEHIYKRYKATLGCCSELHTEIERVQGFIEDLKVQFNLGE